jgi:hypothetical protein
MISNLAMPEKPCKHSQSLIRKSLVDEGLLPPKSLNSIARREIVVFV